MARNLSSRLKKVVAGVLAVLIVAGAVPAELGGVRLFDTAITASAATEVASGTCGENAFWSLDDEGKMTISGSGAMWDYEFTETPWHHYLTNNIKTVEIANGITHIGNNTLCYGTSLKSVSIPASVTSIGDYAFNGCDTLEEVTFASGSKLETIGQYAFSSKSLKSVSIPASVTSIDQGAFYYCQSLKSVTIPEGVTTIAAYAFNECTSLESVTIPDSVTTISKYAFFNCSALKSVTIPEGVTEIGDSAFSHCYSLTSVTIPANVTSIDSFAFGNCLHLAALTFASGSKLTTIGQYAFSNCTSLTSVTIPEGVISIGAWLFDGCTSLASVTIPSSLKVISYCAFQNCTALTSVTIPATVTKIESDAFLECTNLTDVYCLANPADLEWYDVGCDDFIVTETPAQKTKCHVPAAYLAAYKENFDYINVTFVADLCGDHATWTLTDTDNDGVKDKLTIGGTGDMYDYEWYTTPWYSDRANIKSVEIASGITKIGNFAFNNFTNEAFTSVTIPASVTSIGEDAFYYCISLESETIPEGVTTIAAQAFYYCISLESVTIPEGVTTIAEQAFNKCTSLESVTIPASVTSIEADAFYDCPNITDVYCLANPADLTWTDGGCDDFIETPAKTTKCHVAKGTVAAYKAKFGETVNVTFVADVTVTVADGITNGTVTANKTPALSGDEITLTVTPAEHYKLKTLTVTDAAGSPVTVTDNKFTMPDSDVTVSAEFEQITYTLQFDPNGGTQNMASRTVGEGDSFVFPECTITPPANKQFLYWEMTGSDGLYFKDSTEIIAKIFADPNGIITVTAYWEYAPTVLKTAPSAGAITYGQTLADSTLTGGEVTANGTAVAGKFAWSAPDTKPAVSDSESTEYEVTFTPDNTELSAVRTKIKVKVDPAEQTVTAEGYSGTYDGSEHGITVTPADQNAVVYYSETQLTAENYTSGSSTSPKFSAAGNHPVYYYVVLPNYKPVSGSENVVIARTAVSVTVTGHINTVVYDGEEHTVSGYDVNTSNPLYTKTDFVFSGTAEAKRTDVGTTSMGLSESQFANSNTNFDVTFSVYDGYQQIVEKNVTLPAVELQYDSVTYDGSEKKPSVSVKDGEKVIPESEYTVSYSNNINAGTATVTVTDKDGGNYTVSGSKTFEITQAPQDAPAADSFTVSDETVSGKADGKIEGLTDKMEISTSADDGFKAVTDASGDNLAAETYYVRFAADDNHTASEALELTVNAGRKLTVRFVNEDGAELQTGEYDYSDVPEYMGETPEKAADAEYTYTFKEWDKELAAATEDADYIATYDSAKNSYTITFDTDGGSEIVPITQEWGTEISAPEAPTKDGYTFAGWDKDIPSTMPTENVTVKAKWVKNEYTVSFNNAVVNDVDWVHGSTDPLLVVVNGTPDDTLTFDYFEALLVDGSPVDSGSYSKEKGSLKLTLNADYLNTLSVGEHNMQIVFKDNTADCRLTVLPEPTTDSPTQSNNPTTGTSDPFGALALITAASLTALDLIGRKRKKEDQAENK